MSLNEVSLVKKSIHFISNTYCTISKCINVIEIINIKKNDKTKTKEYYVAFAKNVDFNGNFVLFILF